MKLLAEIDAYVRAQLTRARGRYRRASPHQWQVVEILRPRRREIYHDIRPLVRVNVSVVAGDGTPSRKPAATATAAAKPRQRFIEA